MPCYYYETPEERAKDLAEREKRKIEDLGYSISSLKKEIKKLKADRNRLTRLLCEAGEVIESVGAEDLVSGRFLKWYADYIQRDTLRKKNK